MRFSLKTQMDFSHWRLDSFILGSSPVKSLFHIKVTSFSVCYIKKTDVFDALK